ncbi:alpha/beta hydrolase [Streptomyces sp. NPDC051322]|uniref:alpha/beta fold hydrolase n=1 Tax=Streptomyces sp. NPDC051322 TaxID=3154645 RepID=UPI00344CFF23
MTTSAQTHTATLGADLAITLDEAGTGRPVLILHGGGGPATVAPLAAHLSRNQHTLVPTHPGWNGTPRPEGARSIGDIARAYLRYLQLRGLNDVLVVGSSIGGWIGAEMALRDADGITTGLVLIDAVGVHVGGESIRDVFALDAREVARYSFHDPERFRVAPAAMAAGHEERQRANMATMNAVAGDPYMHDPMLLQRLPGVTLPVLVLWGASDRIVTPAYGRAYADALGNARFELIAEAGHLPHLEQPDRVFGLIDAYAKG